MSYFIVGVIDLFPLKRAGAGIYEHSAALETVHFHQLHYFSILPEKAQLKKMLEKSSSFI